MPRLSPDGEQVAFVGNYDGNRDLYLVPVRDGLEVHHDGSAVWCSAVSAPAILDTCGSGDMVSVGVIDWMLSSGVSAESLDVTYLLEGVLAGQRLAAENCAFAGARGLFKQCGPAYAREVLRECPDRYSAASK